MIIFKVSSHAFDLGQTLNGVLVGLVSITASCALVEPWAAVIIGLIGSVVYTALSEFVKRKLRIDDVVDAFAVHCGGGMWGLLAAGLFTTAENHQAAYGVAPGTPHGAFYAPIGQGHQIFTCAIVGIVVIWLWVGGIMLPFFTLMHHINWLRSTEEEELAGMDVSKHGGSAYPDYVFTPSAAPVGFPSSKAGAQPAASAAKAEAPPKGGGGKGAPKIEPEVEGESARRTDEVRELSVADVEA